METRWLVFVAVWAASLGLHAAEVDPHQDWLTFRQELAQLAGGPTGFYAIQDMMELNPGETVSLPANASIDDLRWAKGTGKSPLVRIEYQNKQAIISGPGIQSADLLQLKDRQMQLPNGLTVRVSFLRKNALKAWLYNPRLPEQRKFKGLDYFPYDARGVVQGVFRRNDTPTAVNYLDSRDQEGTMYVVGTLELPVAGKTYTLKTFSYANKWEEIDTLLLLLRDRTSGKTSYGGGRVVDVAIPKGAPPETITVNLNKAYSFLCAHSNFYNCPLILTNYVDAELPYGEKYPPL